jgi:hypothetical protein
MFIFRSKTPIFYLLIFLAKKKFLFYLLIPFTLQVVSDDGKRVKRLQSFTVSDMQDLQCEDHSNLLSSIFKWQ